ncbi:peptidase domain-containing ABC transporter [Paraferrimonas haliotis]|uniref:ABC transporter n=1 Tax=Paraferrimonas haliotis TaxID=2013866 RepID=A0AA37WW30_9GAMM|nr:peptidase domain-containing ABC transporter [Paraferrimonas haliotis]GLS82847.1 ABC transporter [Paraferrimonas haliotis]
MTKAANQSQTWVLPSWQHASPVEAHAGESTSSASASAATGALSPQQPQSLLQKLNFSGNNRLPVIRQDEIAECGLACLAMIANYHGHKMDLAAIRQLSSSSLSGTNLKQLIELGAQLQLNSRALKCPLEQLHQLQLPAILHWDLNHFVVLAQCKAHSLVIHDPGRGKVKLTLEQVAKHFTGIALELSPQKDFKAKQQRQQLQWRQLWQQLIGFKRALAKLIALSLLLQVISLLGPYYMQWVVDEVLVSHDQALLMVLAIGFALISVFKAISHWLRGYLVLRVSALFNLSLGSNLLGHLLRLPMNYFMTRHIGDVVSRFGSLHQVRERLTTGLSETLVDGIMSIAVLVFMLMYSAQLTLVVAIAIALYSLIRLLSYSALHQANEQQIHASAKEQSHLLESLKAMQTLKLFAQEQRRHATWQNRYADVINADIRVGKLKISLDTANKLLFGLENVVVIYLAAMAVMASELSVGMLLAFMAYKAQFIERISMLIEQAIQFKMLRLHLNRIGDIALSPTESNLNAQIAQVNQAQMRLQLVDVCFSYPNAKRPLLNGINLTVKPGQSIAIAGASGSGKTTLMKILLGLIRPTSGQVLVNGQDIEAIGLSQYRRQVGAVMQDDTLLSGSIIDNIAAFDPQPNLSAITAAAQTAHIHQDIEAMPMGYNSLVGDMGNQLSGGQIQRLMLARALYQQPKLLLLDEATSHLDANNETLINDQIKRLDLTRIIIAHRATTIASADQCYRLEHGQLHKEGKHS